MKPLYLTCEAHSLSAGSVELMRGHMGTPCMCSGGFVVSSKGPTCNVCDPNNAPSHQLTEQSDLWQLFTTYNGVFIVWYYLEVLGYGLRTPEVHLQIETTCLSVPSGLRMLSVAMVSKNLRTFTDKARKTVTVQKQEESRLSPAN